MSCEMMPQTEETIEKIQIGLTGTEGLALSFVPNIPPPIIYSTEPIMVMMQTENKGTYDIKKGEGSIYLSGFDPSIIPGLSSKPEEIDNLDGRNMYRKQGDIAQIEFTGEIKLNQEIDKYNTIILATACYKYETSVGASVCIDPNPYTTTRQTKICTPTTIELGSGQGAPITVTKIEVDPSKVKTRFRIHIKNVGKGTVFKESKLKECSPFDKKGLEFKDANVVKIETIEAANEPLINCKPTNPEKELRLINGEGILYCDLDTTKFVSAFITPINIKISYGYRDIATKQIEIRQA